MTQIICDMCPGEVPMECTKTIGTIESGKRWRQRWFTCPICGYEKKINGSGYYQEVVVPKTIEKQLNKISYETRNIKESQ